MLTRILFVGALLLGVFGVGIFAAPAAHAATNQQMNFQGRLLNAQGAVVPDGYYNVQFKIYQDGTGTAAGNPGGTLKWTESWLNSSSQGVLVVNGYMSVQLGSINPFGTQVDWNSDTLWLSMNIGNTNTTCTPFTSCSPDDEMLPMKRLSSVAYAMNATMLGGRDASGFIQNTTTVQTANIAVQSASASSVGAVVQGASAQTVDMFRLQDSAGNINAAFNNTGNQLTLGRIATSGTVTQGKLVLSDGTTDGYSLTLQTSVLTANRTIILPDSTAATDTICLQTAANCGSAGATRQLDNLTGVAINASLTPGAAYANTIDIGSSTYTWRNGYFGGAVYAPAIRPLTDSATALKVQNAAGTSDIVTVDTTNSRVGIGATGGAPTTTLQVAVNNSVTSNPQTLIEQKGTGDATLQIKTPSESWYLGADASDNSTFKINSGLAASSTSVFGNTTTGTATDNDDNGRLEAGLYSSGVNGNVISLSVYMTCPISASPNNQFRMGLFTNNAGTPGTLLTQSSATTLVNGWNAVSVSPTAVTSGTSYWIVYFTNGTATNQNCFRTTTGGGTNVGTWTNSGQTWGPLPSTWPGNASGTPTNDLPAFYATVQTSSTYDSYGATTSLLQLTNTGRFTLRNSIDSTSAFSVQNAAQASVLLADTTNNRVGIALANGETASYDLSFGGGTDRIIGVNTNTSTGVGRSLTLQGGGGNGTNQAGGAVNIIGGAPTGSGVRGAVNLQTTVNGDVNIGNAGSAANTVTLTAGATNGIKLVSDKIMVGNATTTTTIQKTTQTTAGQAGQQLTIQGATSGTTGVGGAVLIQGGNSATGTTGGNLTLAGGTGTTSNGLVILNTSAFQTIANDANCFPSGTESTSSSGCTVAQTSVNNYASVIVGFTQDGQTATLPDPSIATAGRVVYVTASNLTKDFTLSVNGGGQGNQIAMRKNTTATMIWNGADWTAAGASSSTTLQAAYDNTLQSAGGAELVVSKTSATNGLTIRDSSTNPVNGTLLSVQTKSAAGLLQVNSNVTEYASNAGAETAGASATTFPASTWSSTGTATVTRQNVAGNYIATGQGSVSIAATAANSGAKNQLINSSGSAAALTANTTYNVSFTTRLTSGSSTFTDLNVQYSADGNTTLLTACGATSAVNTSIWTKVNCTFTTPASGITSGNAILIRQTASATRTFYVDNLSVTIAADYNFATDGSVTDAGNYATNWPNSGQGTVTSSRIITDGNDASDSAQAAVTTGAANAGIRNKLSSNPLSSTLYRVTVYGKLISGAAFTDFKVRYSYLGSTSTTAGDYVDCVDYNTQTLVTTAWTKVTCYIQTDANTATNPYVYFVEAASGVRTFAVDSFSMTLASITTPNVQVGGGINGGPTTLFTLDKGASAPIASNNDALLGSMYYDTTLGKLQCYEADGWGACGSSPDNIVTISPEYTNAVLHGTGIGTMTSDLCSDYLNINDGSGSPAQPTICGTNETYNFYKWTSPQATAQTYAIYVTYQLPSTFKEFNSGQTSLMGRTDNGSNGGSAAVQYQIYRNSATGLTACGSAISVSSGTQTSWQIGNATGAADPSTCGFAPGNSIVFKIEMTTSKNANAYVGNLNFAFSNK